MFALLKESNADARSPNSFFAFSPHENSFHAVKVNFPENAVKERDTIRGFVFDKDEKDYPEYLFGK